MTEKPPAADQPPLPEPSSPEPGQSSASNTGRLSRRSLLVGAAGGAITGWTAARNVTRSQDQEAVAEGLLPLNLAMQSAMETGETIPITYVTRNGNFEFTVRYAGKQQAPDENARPPAAPSRGRDIV